MSGLWMAVWTCWLEDSEILCCKNLCDLSKTHQCSHEVEKWSETNLMNSLEHSSTLNGPPWEAHGSNLSPVRCRYAVSSPPCQPHECAKPTSRPGPHGVTGCICIDPTNFIFAVNNGKKKNNKSITYGCYFLSCEESSSSIALSFSRSKETRSLAPPPPNMRLSRAVFLGLLAASATVLASPANPVLDDEEDGTTTLKLTTIHFITSTAPPAHATSSIADAEPCGVCFLLTRSLHKE